MKRVPNESLTYEDARMWLDGEPFTGVGYIERDGRLTAEITYRDGIQTGLKRGWWYATGGLSYEAPMFRGVYHGKKREWHRNGQLAEETDYEVGFKRRQKLWDENGNLIEEFELDKNDPNYKRIELYRRAYPDAPPLEGPAA
jgi:antitoxin component YwqK of YwqJK toxin-antitoxin module